MRDLVQAQIDGVEFQRPEERSVFERELSVLINCNSMEKNTPDFILAEFMEKCRRLFVETSDRRDRWRSDNSAIANFGFYVDGYTLTATETIGEFSVAAMDGRTCTIKSAALVAFLDRRLSPNVYPEENPEG